MNIKCHKTDPLSLAEKELAIEALQKCIEEILFLLKEKTPEKSEALRFAWHAKEYFLNSCVLKTQNHLLNNHLFQ